MIRLESVPKQIQKGSEIVCPLGGASEPNEAFAADGGKLVTKVGVKRRRAKRGEKH